MKIKNHHLAKGLTSKDRFAIVALLLVYTIIFAPAIFSDWLHRDFMDIDPQSIMYSIEGLTTAPYYNMNAQYHSQFYGWTQLPPPDLTSKVRLNKQAPPQTLKPCWHVQLYSIHLPFKD